MSGTPIQNNLMEFYELLNLCHQKHFGDLKWFSSHYEEIIKYGVYRGLERHVDTLVKERVEELKTRICPYYLRREKETTLALPPKQELVIWLKLSQKQRKLYLDYLKLRETDADEFPNVLSACERLRRLCSDPKLFSPKEFASSFDEKLNKIVCEADASCDKESGSVKLVFLSELLPDIIKQKECVLIFSQYLGMLDAVEFLVKPKYKFLRLDGKTDPKKRGELIEKFQSGDFPIFLLSYKVGALGFNLTKATRVILLDPSWNPSTDNQAVDRAYRLKQTKSVLVYRLVCCGTIEEREYRNQILKNTLCRMIFGKKEPLRIFREKDIDKTFDVQEKDFNSSAIKRIIDTQLMKTSQQIMPSSLEQYVESLMSKDYILGVSSHSLIVSAVDRLKSRSQSKSPGHRLERSGLDDSVGRAQVASFDHRVPESCRSGTIPCKFFASGNCSNGKACRFSHDSDLNLPKGHVNKNEGFGERRAMRSSVDASAPRDNRFKAIRGASFDHRKHEPCRSGTIPCKFFASGNCRNGKACRFSHDKQTRDIFDNYEPDDYRQGVNNRANMAPLREGSKWSGSASDLNLKKGHGNKNEGLGEQRAMRSSVDASAPRVNRFMAHRMDIDEVTKKNRSDDFRLTTHGSPGMSASKSRGTAIRGVDIEGTPSYTEDQLPTLIGTSGKPDVLDTVRSEAVISEQPDEGKSLRAFKFSLAESVKELLKPAWKAGQINKEAHKNIAKKVVDKVTSSVSASHIPQTQEKIDNYLSANKAKLSKLVQAYVDKVQKENTKVA